MSATADAHHHRSTTKVSHKAFKPRFTSKSALKERAKGKVEQFEKGTRKTPHQQTMSKLVRRNQGKQRRVTNNQSHARANDVFVGKDGAPRIVAVVPLCEDINVEAAVQSMNSSLEIEESVASVGITRVSVERFKQKLAYVTVKRDLFMALDACRVADYVLFVLSAEEEADDFGENMIRCIEGQGVSNIFTTVQGLDMIEPPKRRPQVLTSLKSFITHFFPNQEKVFSLDSRQECQNLARSLCTTTPKGIRWREDRSWMLVEDVRWPHSAGDMLDDAAGEVILTGVIRGKNLKADRLVQVGDWGDFQIGKIVAAPLEQSRKGKANAMTVDMDESDAVLATPSDDRDGLEELAPEEAVMEDITTMAASTMVTNRRGVLLDDHHYYSGEEDEEEEAAPGPRRLPKGTSKYQAAWYLDNVSDSGSDLEDDDEDQADFAMTDIAIPADGLEGRAPPAPLTEGGPSEYPQSEMFPDPAPADEADDIAAYRAKRKEEAAEDLQFPDEIELHPNMLARERLARYRGLKSLRTSPWNTEEDRLHQPTDWSRLLEIGDYRGAKSRVLREALVGGVAPGTRVHVHVTNVPLSLQRTHDPARALGLFSLLRHEHKRTAVNFSFTLDSEAAGPLRSKEELVLQCGPRRLVVCPLFSQPGNTPNDVHKFERYVHPGRTAVASFVGPLTWGSVPALFFRRGASAAAKPEGDVEMSAAPSTNTPTLTLMGHGTSLPTSTSRVIAKRIVLTGEPYKINRRVVTIRYMFFNAEDVAWFKALSLWTNRGGQGTIKESLGTHGYFKALFEGKVGMQEGVGVSLYKRVWPRAARPVGVGEL